MERQKILLFTDWFMPGYKAGGPVRSIDNLARGLGAHCDVFVVTRNTDYRSDEPYDLPVDTWIEYAPGVKVQYVRSLGFSDVKRIMLEQDYSVFHVNGMYSLWFSIAPVWMARNMPASRLIISPRGMLSEGSVGVKSAKKKFFLRFGKLFLPYGKVIFHATSEQELLDIRDWFGAEADVRLVPNLVHIPEHMKISYPDKTRGNLDAIFLGRIAPEKNVMGALHVWAKADGSGILTLVGPVTDEHYWNDCQQFIENEGMSDRVNFAGPVPHHAVNRLIRNHHLLFLPSTGENFGHAIQESLQQGRPVLISDRTPWEGLEAANAGWAFDMEDETGFVQRLNMLAGMEQEAYNDLCLSAARYVSAALDPAKVLQDYQDLFLGQRSP